MGISVQLLGQIELATERGRYHDFVSLVREIAAPGELTVTQTHKFEFRNVEMQYDSFRGLGARCRCVRDVSGGGRRPVRSGRGGCLPLPLFAAPRCRCGSCS